MVVTWIKLLVNYDKNRTEYCRAQSRHYTLCIFFHDFLPHQSGRARRGSRNSLHRTSSLSSAFRACVFTFRLGREPFVRFAEYWSSISNSRAQPSLYSSLFSFLIVICTHVCYVSITIRREEYHLFSYCYVLYSRRSENSYNKIFKINDEWLCIRSRI